MNKFRGDCDMFGLTDNFGSVVYRAHLHSFVFNLVGPQMMDCCFHHLFRIADVENELDDHIFSSNSCVP